MRADWLKLSIFAPKKLCSGRIVNRSEIRTTLILERYLQFENRRQIHFEIERTKTL